MQISKPVLRFVFLVLFLHGAIAAASADARVPRIIFLHGAPGTHSQFENYLRDGQLNRMAKVFADDRRGYGTRAQSAAVFEHQVLDVVADVMASDSPVILVGYSYGAALAMSAAQSFMAQDRITELVLIAGVYKPESVRVPWGLFVLSGVSQYYRTALEEIRALPENLVRTIKRLPLIRARTTVIHGTDDGVVPLVDTAMLREIRPDYILRRGHGHRILDSDFENIRDILLTKALSLAKRSHETHQVSQ